MIFKIVHYQVEKDKLDLVRPAIEKFVRAIRAAEPDTFYEAYVHAQDATKYFHIMSFADAKAERAHQTAPHTNEFVAILYPNCSVQPHFTDLSLVETTR